MTHSKRTGKEADMIAELALAALLLHKPVYPGGSCNWGTATIRPNGCSTSHTLTNPGTIHLAVTTIPSGQRPSVSWVVRCYRNSGTIITVNLGSTSRPTPYQIVLPHSMSRPPHCDVSVTARASAFGAGRVRVTYTRWSDPAAP